MYKASSSVAGAPISLRHFEQGDHNPVWLGANVVSPHTTKILLIRISRFKYRGIHSTGVKRFSGNKGPSLAAIGAIGPSLAAIGAIGVAIGAIGAAIGAIGAAIGAIGAATGAVGVPLPPAVGDPLPPAFFLLKIR
jgi:hypothetical protein